MSVRFGVGLPGPFSVSFGGGRRRRRSSAPRSLTKAELAAQREQAAALQSSVDAMSPREFWLRASIAPTLLTLLGMVSGSLSAFLGCVVLALAALGYYAWMRIPANAAETCSQPSGK